jgi:SAM-dependent methyltransferase
MKTKRSPSPDLETLMPLLIGIWRKFRKEAGPPDVLQTREFRSVVAAVKGLLQGSVNGQSLIGQDYFENRELLGAYILYQWVVHYQEGLSLLGELPVKPKRVLDICSGPAAFAFAALRHGAEEVYAVDQNKSALQLGAEICGRYGFALNTRLWNCLKRSLPIEGKFDLIILGHCLEELFPVTSPHYKENQEHFVSSLLNKLTDEGFLLIVDNSYPDANRRILQLRDQLVSQGVSIQAPCIWRGTCPALTSNSPCYAQREFEKPHLVKEIQRAAQINLGSLKMTYIIFRKSPCPAILDEKLYRVISPPVDSFQGKRYYLCGTDGKKNLGSHIESHPVESKAFEYLKRGELISIENALEKPHSLDIIKGTKVTVKAACGKPFYTVKDHDEWDS